MYSDCLLDYFSIKLVTLAFNWLYGLAEDIIANNCNFFHNFTTSITNWIRPHMTFYWSAIVIIALSCTVFELFNVEWYHDLEIWVRGHSMSFKPVPFERLGAVSYLPSIVTMALSCIICEMKGDIGRKSWFFIPLAFDAPFRGARRNIAIPFGVEKLKWWGYPMVKKFRGYV